MITQFQLDLQEDSDRPLPSFWAYRLYAWLLTQIDSETADILHQQGEKPIAQYLYRDRETGTNRWVVNLMNEEMAQLCSKPLRETQEIPLHTGALHVNRCETFTWTAREMAETAASADLPRRTAIRFITPTAFKSEGRYAIFPQERWLVQALVTKWNFSFPEMPLDDEDAIAALERGLAITNYALRTTRYPLKNVKIPSFWGAVTIESRLPAPLEEIWRLLLQFAPYAGVGIKTTLGMGAICRE